MSPPPPDGDLRVLPAALMAAVLLGGCQREPQRSQTSEAPPALVRIAAASDLTLAFEDLGKLFEARTGQKASFSFGSSGLLAKQLAEGAPFDLFAAANAGFVDVPVKAGACDGKTRARYALGRLVIWSRPDPNLPVLRSLSELKDARFKRIAIANPEHAPYGKAAREALQELGLWQELEPRIVYGENIRQTLQLAQTGNVEASIVALSLVNSDKSGSVTAIEPSLHSPIEQTLVVCQKGKNEAGARAFAELVVSPDGRGILQRYGFGTMNEQASK